MLYGEHLLGEGCGRGRRGREHTQYVHLEKMGEAEPGEGAASSCGAGEMSAVPRGLRKDGSSEGTRRR